MPQTGPTSTISPPGSVAVQEAMQEVVQEAVQEAFANESRRGPPAAPAAPPAPPAPAVASWGLQERSESPSLDLSGETTRTTGFSQTPRVC